MIYHAAIGSFAIICQDWTNVPVELNRGERNFQPLPHNLGVPDEDC